MTTKKKIANVLLEIGTLLMSSGASTSRIRITIGRISYALGYNAELMIVNRALMLTISNEEEEDKFFSRIKRSSPQAVNFKVVSDISRMSWKIYEEKWSIEKIYSELEKIKQSKHYPLWILLPMVGLADVGFCRIIGGGWTEMLFVFFATVAGLFVRRQAIRLKYNAYISVFLASFTASIISGFAVKYGIGENPEKALATSVLFLIPGVPLINSFSDLIDGNILNGIGRGVNGFIIAFAIALGLMFSTLCYKFI